MKNMDLQNTLALSIALVVPHDFSPHHIDAWNIVQGIDLDLSPEKQSYQTSRNHPTEVGPQDVIKLSFQLG
jgi:hypothetical protein